MTDIAAQELAEELRMIARAFPDNYKVYGALRGVETVTREAADRLSAPLPDKIAGLVYRLDRCKAILSGTQEDHHKYVLAQILCADSALQALAKRYDNALDVAADWSQKLAVANVRIAELEAERDAIRDKTIEECASLTESARPGDPLIHNIARSIRALKQQPTASETEGK